MAQQPVFGHPYGEPMSDDQIVDKIIGNAYQIVKSVAERMDIISTVADRTEQLEILAPIASQIVAVSNAINDILTINPHLVNVNKVGQSIANVNAVAGSLTKVNDVSDHMLEVQGIHTRLSELRAIFNDLTKLVGIYTNLPAFLEIHNNLAYLLALVTNITTAVAAAEKAVTDATGVAEVSILRAERAATESAESAAAADASALAAVQAESVTVQAKNYVVGAEEGIRLSVDAVNESVAEAASSAENAGLAADRAEQATVGFEAVAETVSHAVLSYPTLVAAQAVVATLPDDQVVEVESEQKRYRVDSGQLVEVTQPVISAAIVGYDGESVQDVLDGAVTRNNYAELLAYNGRATDIRLTDPIIAGQFHYNAAGTNTTNGGTRFAHSSGVGSWERRFSGAVMIPWFTQGTANDTTAIQAAFSAGKAIRDGGAGYTYNINGTIQLQDGQNMLFSGAEFKQLGVQKPMFNGMGKKRIRARYGRFTGLLEPLYLNSPSSQAICFAIEGADDVNVSDCEFENFMYSPIMSNAGANNVTFKDNRVKGPGPSYFNDINMRGTTGFTLGGTNVVVSGNQVTGTTQGGIITQGSMNVVVSDNIIHDLVNEHGLYLDTALSCVTVSGNVIRNSGAHGTGIKVQLYDSYGQASNNVVITGNAVYSSGSTAISVTNTGPVTPLFTSGVSVTGNSVYAAGQDAISIRYARGATVSGNSVYSCLRYGIELISCHQITTVGNTVVNAGYCGIFDNGCSDVTCVGNTVVNPGTALAGRDNQVGIFVVQESEHFIANNVVRGTTNMSYALWVVAGGATLTLMDNALSGGTEASLRLSGERLRFFRPGPMSSALGADAIIGLPSTLQRGSMPGEFYGTAAPTTGAWQQRDRVHNLYPAAGGVMGWVCVVGGTPGAWKSFGNVAA